MKCVVSVILLLLGSLYSKAQVVYAGLVTEEGSRKGIAWVSVVAEDKNHKPVAFAKTKADGSFTLRIPEGRQADFLTFSLIGYAQRTIETKSFENNQRVSLKEEALLLKEVKVTSNRLRQRNDTLVYSVAGFRHKQDRTIADVISKMPGLEVSGNGTIKFQGKAINGLYIEGMDLMGGAYSMATENIDATKVKSVEVLTNHQKVNVLRGVKFSDQAAINLVLEENAKQTWLGAVEVGGGVTLQNNEADRLLRDGKLMAMAFNANLQSLTMYKWNNTGRDIQHEVVDLTSMIRTTPELSLLTQEVSFYPPDIKKERYLLNDSRILATNWLTKAGKDATIRVQLNGYLDETEGYSMKETVYSEMLGSTIVKENASGLSKSSEWKGEVKYEKNGSKWFVSNVLSGYMDFDKSMAQTQVNHSTISQEATPRKRWVSNSTEIIRPLGKDRVLRVDGYVSTAYMPGSLYLIDSTYQCINQHQTDARLSASFRHKLFKRLYISYQVGCDYRQERFSMSNIIVGQSKEKYVYADCYVRPSLNMKSGVFSWTASMPVKVVWRDLHSTDVSLVAEPSVSVAFQLTNKLTSRFSYSYSWQPPILSSLTSLPVFNSYRSFSTGMGEMYSAKAHNLSMRLEYSNPVLGLFGNMDAMGMRNMNRPVYNNMLDGILFHRFATGELSDNFFWLLRSRLSKSLAAMKTIVSVDGSWKRDYADQYISNRLFRSRLDRVQLGIAIALTPLKNVSIEEKSQYLYSGQLLSDQNYDEGTSMKSYFHSLTVSYMPGKWQIEFSNEIYHSNDQSVGFNYFSDAQLSYREKKYEIDLRLNNIWGRKEFRRHYFNAYSTSSLISVLRPREIILKVSFDL